MPAHAVPVAMRLPESRSVTRLIALLLALSLGAAACGGGETADDAATGSDSSAPETSSDTDPDSDGAASDNNNDEGGAEEAEASSSDDGADAGSDEPPATENLFPDVDVVNISDGSTINLATELGGGDTPLLLWFFAPH